MRNAKIYCLESSPTGTKEQDGYTCAHCQKLVHVAPRASPIGYCRKCAAPICRECLAKPCLPFEKWLDKVERADELRRIMERG